MDSVIQPLNNWGLHGRFRHLAGLLEEANSIVSILDLETPKRLHESDRSCVVTISCGTSDLPARLNQRG